MALMAAVPMLMGTGGNCGAQASALTIRGLALNEIELKDVLRLLWKEIRVAILVGCILAVINFARIMLTTNYGTGLALVISLAMFLTVLLAKSLGCTLPLLAKAVHLDPALIASPLITTIVDATSLTVLFAIATVVFQGTIK